MKKISIRALNILMFSVLIIVGPATEKASAQYQDDAYANNGDGAPSYQTFYDDLSAYGQWVQDPQYGYVWVPDVDNGFRPYYSNGHWVMTEYGNTWVSDYPWGWAAFHYGRWTYDAYYGWVWIPGNEWGPAWVNWRYGGGYYGWAPLGPGVDINLSFGSYYCPDDWWVFLPPTYLYHHHYYRYWGGPRENGAIIRNTTILHNTYMNNNVTYVTGPRPTEVQRVTGQSVPIYHLTNSPSRTSTSVSGSELRLYHPMQVRQTGNGGTRMAPPNAVHAPQGVGRPQSAEANATTPPPFKSVIQREAPNRQPVQEQRQQQIQQQQEQNNLPITPQHIQVVPKHQIQIDEHVTPEQRNPQPAPQQQNYNRQQPGERVPQQNNYERPQQQPQPQPQRAAPQPFQAPRQQQQQPMQPQRSAPQQAPQQRMPQAQPPRPSAPQRSEPARR